MKARVLTLATLAALGAAAAPAHADWGPGAEVVSVDNVRGEQGDSATQQAAITDDGRYVVFQTRSTNFFADDDADPPGAIRQGGVFRYDRATGLIAFVADGDFADEDTGEVLLRGAANPSVSADGRYVVFSTAQRLVAADTNDNIDVYRRDMAIPVGGDRAASGAYVLVSARDGGDVPATYPPRDFPVPGRNPGSQLWPSHAVSADGNVVVFRTADTDSDLPDRPLADTPGQQVLVRDVAAKRTVLVTRDGATGDPVGGAFGPAVVSRDGTTISWVGRQAQRQTRFLPGEVADADESFYLWRRWNDPGAPTRRVTGMADPDDPGCGDGAVTVNPTLTGPCYGPLTTPEETGSSTIGAAAPALSADGYEVAFLVAGGPRPAADTNSGLDLWITSMRPGVTRKAGSRELTRDPIVGNPRASAPITSVTLSADGRHLAFTSGRTAFLLPSPTPVGPFRELAGSGGDELYAIDLNTDRLTRVMHGFDGGDANDGALVNPTITSDGTAVSFISPATNLFFGDANQQPDAFVATLAPPGSGAPPPAGIEIKPGVFDFSSPTGAIGRTLSAKAHRRADGTVGLEIRTPADGRVSVTALERKPAKGKKARQVAKVAGRAKEGKTLRLVLKARGTFATAVGKGRGVLAKATVTFTPRTGKARRKTLEISFRKSAGKPAKKGRK